MLYNVDTLNGGGVMKIGDLIKKYRNDHNLSLRAFAQKTGLSYAYISILEKGIDSRTNKPTQPTLESVRAIAKGLNLNMDDLLNILDENEDENKNTISNLPDVVQIPLLGRIVAGYPEEMFTDIIDYIGVPSDMVKGDKELFALKTKGDSMQPNFIENDILIFEKSSNCESGQYCAVSVNGDEATFKKVIKNENGIMLQPLNPNYESKFYTNKEIKNLPVTIIGVLKQTRRNF